METLTNILGSLGVFVFAILLGVCFYTSCAEETRRVSAMKCFEQTKDSKCWHLGDSSVTTGEKK